MPQRKETPAARAALARRRQRVAQTSQNPQISNASGRIGIETETAVSVTSASITRSQTKLQSIGKGASPYDGIDAARAGLTSEEKPATDKFIDLETDATRIFNNTVNFNEWKDSSESRDLSVERISIPEESSSSAGNISLAKSQLHTTPLSVTSESIQRHQKVQTINFHIRTETEKGLTSAPSTVGEYNIETVLQDGTSTSDQLYSSPSTSDHNQRMRNHKKQVERNSREKPEQHHQEKYERMSNFGYVERTSPQPMVPDRRDLIRYESSSPSKEALSPSPSGLSSDRIDGKSISNMEECESSNLQLPSLELCTPVHTFLTNDNNASNDDHSKTRMSGTAADSDVIEKSTTIRKFTMKNQDEQKRKQRSASATQRQIFPRKEIGKSKEERNSTTTTGTNSIVKKSKEQRSKTVVDNSSPRSQLKNDSVGGRRSLKRISRIPSPTPINPDAGRLLPRRSASPKRIISPEKKLSPRRFRPAQNSSTKNTTSPPKSLPVSRVSTHNSARFSTSRERSNNRLNRPTSVSNGTNRRVADTISKSSVRPNSIFPCRNRPAMLANDNKTNKNKLVLPYPNQGQSVENLSEYLMDSCSIAEASLVPDIEQHRSDKAHDLVLKSRYFEREEGMASNAINLSSPQFGRAHRSNKIDEEIDKRIHSQFASRQNVSFNNDEIERYRPHADENDAKHLNVGPRLTNSETNLGGKLLKTESLPFKSYTIETQKGGKFEGTNRKCSENSKELQAVDAACFYSGDIVMLRSCSISAALQKESDAILAKFDGPCLGNDEELLKIISIKDGRSSPLKYGDIVLLRSLSTQSKNNLCARRSRSDVDGRNEIGFFDDGFEKSSHWVIHTAKPGTSVAVGRAALSGNGTIPDTSVSVRSGNSILLVNRYNGGLLSIKDGVAVLMTDSYDPTRMPFLHDPSLLGRTECHDQIEPSVHEVFQLLKYSVPPCPTWVAPRGLGERLFLTGSYLSEPLRNAKENIMVDSNLTLEAKESILVDEVIGSFLGLEGLYVRLQKGKEQSTPNIPNRFQLYDGNGITFDLGLRNLVEQILPLSTSYVSVRNFVGFHHPGYEYGRVMQAFCEGLDFFLQQFLSFVAQLERKIREPPAIGAITMKNIHFEITPLIHSMAILEHATKTVYNKKGGGLINALRSLEKRVYMGDTVAKDILGTLLDRISVPYAEMLSTWLQSGRLYDPYEEFMIKKTHDTKHRVELDGDSWAALFTISEEHVIDDIVRNEKSKNKILVTGKYWNAVQACISDKMSSREIRSRPLELKKLNFQSDLSGISAYIDSMYESASQKLMNVLKNKFHLKESLQIMKRYFLLDQGDFLVHFLEATGEELAKPFEEVSLGRVQHFLGISVQYTESQREDDTDSSPSFDTKNRCKLSPYNLRCRLSDQSLVSYLDSLYGGIKDRLQNTPSRQKYGSQQQGTAGFDFFEIDFPRVPFPISLIVSPTSMENYRLLFRHLFFAKHVERRLVGVWSDHQVLKKLDSLRGLLGRTFLLRQRMLHFVQNLMNYMTFEVVESNWLEMLSSIEVHDDMMSNQNQTVDDLLDIHDGFLQKTIDSCLLTNAVLIKSLVKLLNTCLLFTDQMKRFMDTTRIYDEQFNIAAEKRGAVQRNLNERMSSQARNRDKKKLRRSLLLVKEERDILLQRQTRRVGREICSESYKRMICRFEEVFNNDLRVFMTQLNRHTSSGIVANLRIRLDWNGYITSNSSLC